ncbi:unnamed protein product, partial [Prorocentrum cordatum]
GSGAAGGVRGTPARIVHWGRRVATVGVSSASSEPTSSSIAASLKPLLWGSFFALTHNHAAHSELEHCLGYKSTWNAARSASCSSATSVTVPMLQKNQSALLQVALKDDRGTPAAHPVSRDGLQAPACERCQRVNWKAVSPIP